MWQNHKGEALSVSSTAVHLWRAQLAGSDAELLNCQGLLSTDEINRATRFIKSEDRVRYIFYRACLRKILSFYVQIVPEKITFSTGEKGKPFLAGSDLQFNVSHSGDYLLIGVTRGQAIGVDIENVKPNKDFLALAKRFFADSEYQEIKKYPTREQIAAFYRCWTRKEAFIKAIGLGLSFPLSDFEVDVSEIPSDRSCLLHVRDKKFAATDWMVRSILLDDLKSAYFAAFAMPQTEAHVFYWNFSCDMC